MPTNWLNIGLLPQASVEKTVHWVKTYWLSSKEKVPGAAVMLTLFWEMKGFVTIDFHEKGLAVNCASYYQLFRQNLPYLLNTPHIYV